MPKLEATEPNLFLGSAVTDYPIEVPPGRNGLAPKLGLSYSSAATDMMGHLQQASFVGAGWSFSTSYIARDVRDTYDSSDDVFTLVLNGVGNALVQDNQVATTYHTWSEQYWRITYDPTNDRWIVTTTDGTQFQFGYTSASRAKLWRRDSGGQEKEETYTWWLEKVVDTHSNEIAYSYLRDR
ncbi:MAG: SpvB/TcaC N-terminal domain-containing protein, partial [Chloroflexota bacterium]